MYFTIRNSEDGLYINQFTATAMQEYLEDVARENPELRPDCRVEFTDTVPDDYTDTNKVFIIKGDVVIPQESKVVTEYVIS